MQLAEPMGRQDRFKADILCTKSLSIEDQVEELGKLDFAQFMAYKNEFLKGSTNPTKSEISLIISYCNLLINI